MSCRRACGRDFYRDRISYDNRRLYDSLRYSPYDRPFDRCRKPDCRRRLRRDFHRWDDRYPIRYR